jgi:tetratricopeptide (TPR) repeat protein
MLLNSQNIQAIKSVALAISLGLSAFIAPAMATKLVAPPLPREREIKDFNEAQEVAPQATRFKRRPDYREVEAQKKQQQEEEARRAEEAKLKAQEEGKRQQAEQIENIKKRQQMAVEANNRAVAFGKQNRWLEAIEAHEEAVKLDPHNKQFRINLSAARTAFAQSRMAQGDFQSAASLLRKALAAAPDNGLAGKLLAEAMRKLGRDPLSADIRLATGDQLAAVGELEEASVEYQAALQLDGSARCYVKMGDVALRYGQITTATNWYRQAIVKDPDHAAAHRQLGLLSLSQKDYTGAAASLRKAVILDPKDVAAGQALVEIWRRQVAANPLLAENHLGLAGALQLTGDFVGAESEYRKLEALDPKHPGLASGRASLGRAIQHAKAEKHCLAAETLFNQGLRREALAEISQAVMAEPRNARFQFLLGECLEASGDYQGAHRAYLTCVLIDPENNKEAAARMREMQNSMKNRGASFAQMGGQIANQVVNQLVSPANQGLSPAFQPVQQPARAAAPAAVSEVMPRKDMFEGGSGAPAAFARTNLPFRTHEEEAPAAPAIQGMPMQNTTRAQQAQAEARVASARQNQPDEAHHDELARVTELEAQKNYSEAVSVLRQLLAGNLQNAAIHHRLAVNLLASGQVTEAISEFRIASALDPGKKAYADDLARAMVIHKRSLMSDAGNQVSSENNGVTGGTTR